VSFFVGFVFFQFLVLFVNLCFLLCCIFAILSYLLLFALYILFLIIDKSYFDLCFSVIFSFWYFVINVFVCCYCLCFSVF